MPALNTPGQFSYGRAINDAGQVTGWCDSGVFISNPEGEVTELGFSGSGWDINAHGQITGTSDNQAYRYTEIGRAHV